VLQHPERVVPMSECERFEPHFQPNVALAPPGASPVVPTSGLPLVSPATLVGAASPVVPTDSAVPPLTSGPHRRHRRHGHPRSNSPDEKTATTAPSSTPSLEGFASVSVKIERPSSPCPEAAYTPVLACSAEKGEQQQSVMVVVASEKEDGLVGPLVIANPRRKSDEEKTKAEEEIEQKGQVTEERKAEEEERNAAVVTSSTVREP
jgi:hypothetical protein